MEQIRRPTAKWVGGIQNLGKPAKFTPKNARYNQNLFEDKKNIIRFGDKKYSLITFGILPFNSLDLDL
jgi:hypothetical protein